MNYLKAIQLLAPYHTAKLTCINPDSLPGKPTGQLSTGHADMPFLSVNDGMVCSDDLYTVLDLHSQNQVYAGMFDESTYTQSFGFMSSAY